VAIEFRPGQGRYDRLPALAADLVDRKIDVIAAFSIPAVLAAKNATSTIPIVFSIGVDPVEFGLVNSLARPGGNLTGVSALLVDLMAKRLDLLSELVPGARVAALLVKRARSGGAARGRARWRRCGSPLPSCHCAQLARRSSRGAGRSRARTGNKSEPGRCTRSARRGADCESAPNRDPAEFCPIRLMNREKSPHGWGLNRRRSGPRPGGKSAKQLNILRQFVGGVPRRC
jgi:ABC transporter substrate binding protein